MEFDNEKIQKNIDEFRKRADESKHCNWPNCKEDKLSHSWYCGPHGIRVALQSDFFHSPSSRRRHAKSQSD